MKHSSLNLHETVSVKFIVLQFKLVIKFIAASNERINNKTLKILIQNYSSLLFMPKTTNKLISFTLNLVVSLLKH